MRGCGCGRIGGALIGLALIAVLVVMAVVGPYLVPYSANTQHVADAYQSPSWRHLFGTDQFGRDQFARTWKGTRVSLFIGLLAGAVDLAVGSVYGALSGYHGGRLDSVLQRVLEVVVGIPQIVVLILMLTVFPAGIVTISIALAIVGWVPMALLVRGQVLKLREEEYFLAARTLGAGGVRLVFRHLMPNLVSLMVIQLMFTIPYAIFFEAFLSFIGLGIQPPSASLGSLIQSGFEGLRVHPYLLLWPSVVLCLLMVSFNVLADGLRDALDPKMRR